MTREQANIYVSLGKDKLRKIAPHLAREIESLTAFSLGHDLQYRQYSEQMNAQNGEWKDCAPNVCSFSPGLTYRVKPEEPSNEPWKPKEGVEYFHLSELLQVQRERCIKHLHDGLLINAGNCFRTIEEAEAAVPRVKAALKGDTTDDMKVWLTENDIKGGLQLTIGELKKRYDKLSRENEALKLEVPYLDGKPLTDGEKALIRFFRADKGKYLNLLTDAALNLIRVLHEHNICEVLGEASQALVYIDDDDDVNFKKDIVALEFVNADEQEAVATAFVEFVKEKEERERKNEN